MKNLFILIILAVLLANCNKDENVTTNACNSQNPMEDIGWLKAMKDSITNCTCQISIIQGTYHNHPVFWLAFTDPLCDGIFTPILLNCEGKKVKTYTGDDVTDFYSQVTIDTILYSCKK